MPWSIMQMTKCQHAFWRIYQMKSNKTYLFQIYEYCNFFLSETPSCLGYKYSQSSHTTIHKKEKKNGNITKYNWVNLVLLSPDMPCLCKKCRSRSTDWSCTVCHLVFEFVWATWIKYFDWLKIRSGCGILIYSADWIHLIDFLSFLLSVASVWSTLFVHACLSDYLD